MRKVKTFLIINYMLYLSINATAQDVSFSQSFANRLYLNPALAGISKEKRAAINYRNQYAGSAGIYNTYSLSYDQYAEKINGGLGFSLINDAQGAGAINQMTLAGIYSYQFKADRFLSFAGAIQATGVYRSINYSKLIFEDQYNPNTESHNEIPTGENVNGKNLILYPDFSTGIISFYKDSYAGIAVFHLLKPFQSESDLVESRLPRKFTLYAGTFIPVLEKRRRKEVLKLNPNLIYTHQKNLNQLVYGLEALIEERFVAGLWIRQNIGMKFSTLIFTAGVSLDNIRLRYSHDAAFSKPSMQYPRMGANEISIIIEFAAYNKKQTKAIKCPKF